MTDNFLLATMGWHTEAGTSGPIAIATFGWYSDEVIERVLTTITVTPASVRVRNGRTRKFSAVGLDQFGDPLDPQPIWDWMVSGGGQIDSTGLFTAEEVGQFKVTVKEGE